MKRGDHLMLGYIFGIIGERSGLGLSFVIWTVVTIIAMTLILSESKKGHQP